MAFQLSQRFIIAAPDWHWQPPLLLLATYFSGLTTIVKYCQAAEETSSRPSYSYTSVKKHLAKVLILPISSIIQALEQFKRYFIHQANTETLPGRLYGSDIVH